jgi:uncharacterized Fe-S center protein
MSRVIHVQEELKGVITEQIVETFEPGERVALKLHFGEPGNSTRLKPGTVRPFVDILKTHNIHPFLFDSPVMYHSPRNTAESYLAVAKKHGFFDLGCPVVISDEPHTVETQYLPFHLCQDLVEADGVFLLSHFTGHDCSGAGGSIKNLGMGGMTRETKAAMHRGAQPLPVDTCSLCSKCQEVCPTNNIRLMETSVSFDKTVCIGCSKCIYACPEGNIKPRIATFDFLLALAAHCAHRACKKVLCINIMKNITRLCDCTPTPGQVLAEDLGMLLSHDIVSVDKAGYDLVFNQYGFDVFKVLNRKSPLKHIEEAHNLGLGSLEYQLEPADTDHERG